MGIEVTCTKCYTTHKREELKRHCSNCFACTGCLKYICATCGEVIVIREVKQMK